MRKIVLTSESRPKKPIKSESSKQNNSVKSNYESGRDTKTIACYDTRCSSNKWCYRFLMVVHSQIGDARRSMSSGQIYGDFDRGIGPSCDSFIDLRGKMVRDKPKMSHREAMIQRKGVLNHYGEP